MRNGLFIRKGGLALLVLLLIPLSVRAQVQKIMPVGNSITWGKVNGQPPPSGSEGYRLYLHEKLVAERVINPSFPEVEFVGPDGSIENRGLFMDGARVGFFIHPDSAKGDITTHLNTYQPNVVILHIGTNDIADGKPIGNFATTGTTIHRLYTLVNKIVSSSYVDHLLLCKIIPNFTTPGLEETTQDYNNAIEIMVEEFSGAKRSKIELVPLWAPFYFSKSTYYNLAVDKRHPNLTGYDKMASVFFQHIKKAFNPSFTDHFDRGSLGSDWVAASGIQIVNVGESGGGALRYTGTSGDWGHLAVWKSSKGLVTVSFKAHPDSSNSAGLQSVAMAVGLDSASATASGYMVWIYGGKAKAYTLVDGAPGVWLNDDKSMTNLTPNDIFKVTYRNDDPSGNILAITINDDPNRTVTIKDKFKRAGNGDVSTLYSGVYFRGLDPTPRYFIDYFKVEAQLPDIVPPGAPGNFNASLITNTSITLYWNAPGDDGYIGTAAAYELRYSFSQIVDEDDFLNANIVPGVKVPDDAGTYQEHVVTGLMPGQKYFFRIRAVDSWGNRGDLSVQVSASTSSSGILIENFDRPPEPDGTIGNDWIADPAEYTIEYDAGTGEGELINFLNDGQWAKVAVYKGRTNPQVVKIVWGRQATVDGIGRGGVALMLTSASLNANGYLLFVRTPSKMVYLYNIQNGEVDQNVKIDETPYTRRDIFGSIDLPQKGDTMSVVLDWNTAAGHKFDVFINNDPAMSRSLYDPEKRNNSSTKYSGIMLSGVNKTNSIASFITQAVFEPKVGTLTKIQGDGASGIVNTMLTDSLIVQVKDVNNTPMIGIPVWFWAVEPADASVTCPPRMTDPINIEAEWTVPQGTYVIEEDIGASGGRYAYPPSGDPESGWLDYYFYVEEAGNYYIWGRLISASIGSMTLFVEMDEGTKWVWNSFYTPAKDRFSNKWQWDLVNHNYGPPINVTLSKGQHHLKIYKGHTGVKIDKFLLTKSGSYSPFGKETVNVLLTDQNGKTGTQLTLSEVAGDNHVKVRAFGASMTEDFHNTGLADSPIRMTKSNDNQTGAAKDSLEFPLAVTLYDQYDNTVPNISVTFSIVEGEGTLISPNPVTNGNGQASTQLTLGRPDILNPVIKIKATFTGYTGQDVLFTVTVTEGLISQIIPLTVTGIKHYIGDILPNFLQVKLLDDNENPVEGVPVDFDVIKGKASVGLRQKLTNSQGIARDTLFLSDSASVVIVEASGGGQDTTISDSVFYKGTQIDKYSGHGQIAIINSQTNYPIRVKVRNGSNGVVANHPVTFVTTGHGFHFPDGSDTTVAPTNSEGLASTYVVMGPTHGLWEDIVEAHSTDGFYPLSKSPLYISLTGRSSATKLKNVMEDSIKLEGVVKTVFPYPLKVQMVDKNNQPVPEQPVIFTIKAGDGKFEGYDLPVITKMTDGDGHTEIYYELGTVAGEKNNRVEASATDGKYNLGGSPVTFELTAKSSSADSIHAFYENGIDSILIGVVGKPLKDPVYVQVLDEHHNPVPNEIVIFNVVAGGGVLDGGANTTVVDSIDNALGTASVVWTLGIKVGVNHNILEAISTNGIDTLKGSPVRFYSSAIADSVNPNLSKIETDSTLYQSTYQDTCWVTVTLMDKYENPVAAKKIELEVSGTGSNIIYNPVLETDSTGKTTGYFLSQKAGEKIIKAFVKGDNIQLNKEARVIFVADSAANMENLTQSPLTGNVGTVLRDSLKVLITDTYGNPVEYGPVTFKVTSGGGQILENQPVTSDSNGLAWAHLILGPGPGQNVVEVTSGVVQNPVYIIATGQQGEASFYFYVSGSEQTGPAGGRFLDPFVVGVTDIEGYPVYGVDVKFEVVKGNGRVESSAVKTDMYGFGAVYFIGDTLAGSEHENLIRATSENLAGVVMFKALSVAGSARKLIYLSGNQTGEVGEKSANPLRVQVTDKYGNSVQGVSVLFEVFKGDAHFNGSVSTSVPSTSNGEASVYVTFGESMGTVEIHASGKVLENSPVKFTLYARGVDAEQIIRFKIEGEEDIIKAAVGKPLVDPLRVQVIDQYSNPVEEVPVLFTKTSGGGSITGPEVVPSDPNGIAGAQFMAGPNPGTSQVVGMLTNEKKITFTIQIVNNPNSPVLEKDLIYTNYDFYEGEEKKIPMVASDRDQGDQLTFQALQPDYPGPPKGAVVEKQSATQAFFEWKPDYDQDGFYTVILRVVDNQGGCDADTTTIQVHNRNRLPQIISTIPSGPDTAVIDRESLVFWVNAWDPDGDELSYEWLVDGKQQNTSSEVFELLWSKYYEGIKTVGVKVSDGDLRYPPSFQWTVEIIPPTSVELTEFAAHFDQWKNEVTIHWETSFEIHNQGFDVLRSHRFDGHYEIINEELIKSREDSKYQFIDNSIDAGITYYYKIVDLDTRGRQTEHGPVLVTIPRPTKYFLSQNYPNPFNPGTKIRYNVPQKDRVQITVFNMIGQKVKVLVDKDHNPGYYIVEWNGHDESGRQVSTGIYLYQLRSQDKVMIKRMIKLK